LESSQIDPFTISNTQFSEIIKESNADIVRTLAVKLNLSGPIAEEICFKAKIEKKKQTSELDKSEHDSLFSTLKDFLTIFEKNTYQPMLIKKEENILDILPIPFQSYDQKEMIPTNHFTRGLSYFIEDEKTQQEEEQVETKSDKNIGKINRILLQQQEKIKILDKNIEQKKREGDLYAAKKTPYEGVHTVSSKANTVLANVEILIEWEDDNTYGLLREKGLDLLSAEIANSGGTPSIKDFVGNGSDSFFFSINSRPKSDSIKAHSSQDAMDIIEDEISGLNTASFDVVVSVSPGEKVFRLLKFIKDKGNDFSLTARYTYYSYELETEDDDSGNDSDDEDIKDTGGSDYGHNVGNFYVNLGYGRGMI